MTYLIRNICAPVLAIAAVGITSPFVCHADYLVLQDDTFADADWSRQLLINTFLLGSSESAMQQTTGGFPGAYRHSAMFGNGQLVGGAAPRMHIGHFNSANAWDPATDGAVNDIDISYNAVAFDDLPPGQTVPTGRLVRFGFLIRQSGIVYEPVSNPLLVATPDDTWDYHSTINLDDSDFQPVYGGTGTPDFSTSGDPVEFGYLVRMSSTSFHIDNEMGVDNFRIGVDFVTIPEPSAVALLLAGGLLGLMQRR